MRPGNLKTKIFLDSGDVEEAGKAIALLGFLDGQTTNPTLISRSPEAKGRLENEDKFSADEIIAYYKKVVKELAGLMPEGSISVEVHADQNTIADEMLDQAIEMKSWIPDNAQIKFPTTQEGIQAAIKALEDGIRVNMTLCFSQDQAAAVYAATRGAKIGDVYLSPFIGRLDDRGENGMELIANILRMFETGDGHVQVLTASVRKLEHLLYALYLGSDIITAPYQVLEEWNDQGLIIPNDGFNYVSEGLGGIPFKELDIQKDWSSFNLYHDLTDIGIEKFSADWNALIES